MAVRIENINRSSLSFDEVFREAWRLFKQSPFAWLGILVAGLLVTILLSMWGMVFAYAGAQWAALRTVRGQRIGIGTLFGFPVIPKTVIALWLPLLRYWVVAGLLFNAADPALGYAYFRVSPEIATVALLLKAALIAWLLLPIFKPEGWLFTTFLWFDRASRNSSWTLPRTLIQESKALLKERKGLAIGLGLWAGASVLLLPALTLWSASLDRPDLTLCVLLLNLGSYVLFHLMAAVAYCRVTGAGLGECHRKVASSFHPIDRR